MLKTPNDELSTSRIEGSGVHTLVAFSNLCHSSHVREWVNRIPSGNKPACSLQVFSSRRSADQSGMKIGNEMTIQIFNFEGTPVRDVLINGEPWFVGVDVCRCLDISNHSDALGSLPDDERDGVGITDPMGRGQTAICINEPGLYRLIFKSRKPEAERFKTWVVREVLPQIRRTGRYAPQGAAAAIPSTGKNDLESRYLALLDEHMQLLKWKADFFEKQAQPKPKRTARRALSEEEQIAIKQLISEGKSDSEIALQTGRANSTVWQIRRLVDAQSNGEAGNA